MQAFFAIVSEWVQHMIVFVRYLGYYLQIFCSAYPVLLCFLVVSFVFLGVSVFRRL